MKMKKSLVIGLVAAVAVAVVGSVAAAVYFTSPKMQFLSRANDLATSSRYTQHYAAQVAVDTDGSSMMTGDMSATGRFSKDGDNTLVTLESLQNVGSVSLNQDIKFVTYDKKSYISLSGVFEYFSNLYGTEIGEDTSDTMLSLDELMKETGGQSTLDEKTIEKVQKVVEDTLRKEDNQHFTKESDGSMTLTLSGDELKQLFAKVFDIVSESEAYKEDGIFQTGTNTVDSLFNNMDVQLKISLGETVGDSRTELTLSASNSISVTVSLDTEATEFVSVEQPTVVVSYHDIQSIVEGALFN